MTEMRWDVAPEDRPAIPASEQRASSGFLVYTIGLLLAVILTATSFWVANTSAIWAPGVPAGLAVLAIAQMGVHLVFFLHITTGPDSSHNVLALAFGVLIVRIARDHDQSEREHDDGTSRAHEPADATLKMAT
ncbi:MULTISPECIES: cytochrome o ubiquinol oxidase subunit IV [unclassified Bradyrhizobium]|uniref:cytochrome o ubiquinol oxidase subunit IV n=1 Tax=unclassified Bradyrhizobium TaxID=2631580 RepID=UPI0039C87428